MLETTLTSDLNVVKDWFSSTKNELLDTCNYISNKDCMEVSGIKVMKRNLRVDSKSWRIIEAKVYMSNKKIKVRVNDSWEIYKFCDGKFKWEQLFTRDSAMRESKNQWLTILTKRHWALIKLYLKKNIQQKNNILKKLKLKYCGLCNENALFAFEGKRAHFWLPGEDIEEARYIWYQDIFSDGCINDKNYGFSVRCIY